MSQLSDQDFQRLQENLLDLKTRNYQLEEYARKSKHEIGESSIKIKVLEEALGKANRTIEKSKKAAEVQHMQKENTFLLEKLAFQEEQFRHQNQTLMAELAKLVANNEQLEAEVANRGNSTNQQDNSSPGQERSRQVEEEVQQLEEKNQQLMAELTRLRSRGDTGLRDGEEDADRLRARIGELEARLEAREDLEILLESERAEGRLMQDHNRDLKQQVQHLQQEAAQGGGDKEMQLQEMNKRLGEIQAEKEKVARDFQVKTEEFARERGQFSTHSLRLEQQLTEARQDLADNLSRNEATLTELEAKIRQYESHVAQYPLAKFQELEAAKICGLNDLAKARSRLEAGEEEVRGLRSRLEEVEQRLGWTEEQRAQLEREAGEVGEVVNSLRKTGESRKTLIDEMAIELQVKVEEHKRREADLLHQVQVKVEEFQTREADLLHQLDSGMRELKSLGLQINKATEEKERLMAVQAETVSKLTCAVEGKQWLETELKTKEAVILDLKEAQRQELQELRQDLAREKEAITSEAESKLRHLETQLEISSAQTVEFEELVNRLKQDLKDSAEDKKIGEKKGQAHLKDLRTQLQREKKRNEKLQERMKDCLIDTFSTASDPAKELDPDRSSISSWSLMSGNNERESSTPSQNSPVQPVGNSLDDQQQQPVQVGPAAQVTDTVQSPADALQSDNDSLLSRLAELQQEKWRLEERLVMLEQSGAAMADEICRKNEVIQFYCMEAGGRVIGRGTSADSRTAAPPHHQREGGGLAGGLSTLSPPGEKMRHFVEKLVHNTEQADAHAKEVQRMQQMLEETLTKNMHLQENMDQLSQEVVRLSKLAVMTDHQ